MDTCEWHHTTMQRNQSLQMNNILFYIIYSNHVEFVSFLVQEMLHNIKAEYMDFSNTHEALCQLEKMLKNSLISQMHCVVIFFFFLTIDPKMRHWILNSQLSTHDNSVRNALIRKNVDLVPGGSMHLKTELNNPFLGQSVSFQALDPHVAVPILTTIMKESFFQPIFTSQDTDSIDKIYRQLKLLVMFA